MDNEKNIHSQEEQQLHPIIIWILASILFHLLLSLGFLSIKLKKAINQNKQFDQKTDQALLILDPKQYQQPPKQPVPSTMPQPNNQPTTPPPAQKTKEEPKPITPSADPSEYIIIPGKKGVDKQDLKSMQDLTMLPSPENQKIDPAQSQPKTKSEQSTKKEELKTPSEDITHNQSSDNHKNFALQKHSKATKTASQANHEKRLELEKQDPYNYVPTPSRTISFKDLHLGFNPLSHNVGNSSSLIQHGFRFDTPDPAALKYITYYNQCADMMRAAFQTHPQVSLRPYQRGTRYTFTLTVDRNGRLIKFNTITPTEDIILNKIIAESMQSITLFPPVPSFIHDDPFTMRWAFLH